MDSKQTQRQFAKRALARGRALSFIFTSATLIASTAASVVEAAEFPRADYFTPTAPCSSTLASTLPPLEGGTFYKTKNRFGYMQKNNDPYSQAFIEFSSTAGGIALDVGAAYGVATLAVLRGGGKIIASDIDPDHLNILWSLVDEKTRADLRLYFGGLPSGLRLPSGSVRSILASRVHHFLNGEENRESLREYFRLLKPGGKVFVTAETPYLIAAKNAGVLDEFYQRRDAGDPWPGLTTEVQRIYPTLKEGLPKLMNYMDVFILEREFAAAGFEIEKVGTFARPEFPAEAQLDGRESVGIIAVKPLRTRQ